MSALSLHLQSETSNRFLEIVTIVQGDELECPDQPRPVAAVHRPRPGRAAPRLAAGPGSTERSACGIVTDLTAAGYVAKQKRRPPQPLPDPGAPPAARTRQPGTRHRRRPGPARGRRRETAADRDRTGLRPPHPTRSSAMDPDHRRPSRPGPPPDESRRPCIAALSGNPASHPSPPASISPGLLPVAASRLVTGLSRAGCSDAGGLASRPPAIPACVRRTSRGCSRNCAGCCAPAGRWVSATWCSAGRRPRPKTGRYALCCTTRPGSC